LTVLSCSVAVHCRQDLWPDQWCCPRCPPTSRQQCQGRLWSVYISMYIINIH